MDPDRDRLLTELFGDADVPAGLEDRLLRTGEVARLFQVSERTVAEWARAGRIRSLRTPGGHRLYPAEEVRRLLAAAGGGPEATEAAAPRTVVDNPPAPDPGGTTHA